MRVLGIESSCDETAAAVVDDGKQVLSNVIASQVRVHRVYQGVVPELASRSHIEFILPVVQEALKHIEPKSIDAIAVTAGPGLIGSLLVGVETAKTLAWSWDLPLIPVHHTQGHLYSVFCELPDGKSRLLEIPAEDEVSEADWSEPKSEQVTAAGSSGFTFPYLGLAISGGHSHLYRVDAPGKVHTLGATLDDAPGEAYDKVAKFLGLEYPGGPVVDRLATHGNARAFNLPRPMLHKGLDFSFSGLKTAVVRVIEENGGPAAFRENETKLADLCASFQEAVIDVLLTKADRALRQENLHRFAITGGVACNRGLRAEAARRFKKTHLLFPPPVLCTDNAAMIAAVASHLPPLPQAEALAINARAGWEL